MKFVATCSVLGLMAGALAAKALQPAHACSCLDVNPELLELAVVSTTRTDSTESLPDTELARWDGSLSAQAELSDEVQVILESGGDEVSLWFDVAPEETP